MDLKTSHKGNFFETIQLFEHLEFEDAKKSKYWENRL